MCGGDLDNNVSFVSVTENNYSTNEAKTDGESGLCAMRCYPVGDVFVAMPSV